MRGFDACLTDMTRGQPLCAGVLIVDGGRLLLALGTHDRWETGPTNVRVPVTGIGGGQEPGEDLLTCAQREAHEELGCPVDLLHASATFVELPDGTLQVVSFDDRPAPILYQVQRRATSVPYALGLPGGDRLHVGIYRAVPRAQPRPADVPGLAWVPPEALAALCRGVEYTLLASLGIALRCSCNLPANAILVIPQLSTERMLADVVSRFGGSALGERS